MHGCLRCNDTGLESCFECFGFGQITCGCGGSASCPRCQGGNRRDCPECSGTGRRDCQICRGPERAGGSAGRRERLRLVRLPGEGSSQSR